MEWHFRIRGWQRGSFSPFVRVSFECFRVWRWKCNFFLSFSSFSHWFVSNCPSKLCVGRPFSSFSTFIFDAHSGASLSFYILLALPFLHVHRWFLLFAGGKMWILLGLLSFILRWKVPLQKKKKYHTKTKKKIIMILTAWKIFDANFVTLSYSCTEQIPKRVLCSLVELVKSFLMHVCLWCQFNVLSGRQTTEKNNNKKKIFDLRSFRLLSFSRLTNTHDEKRNDKALNCNQIMHADHVFRFMLRRLTITQS